MDMLFGSKYVHPFAPKNASDCLALGWDCGGQEVGVDEVVEVTLALAVSCSIEGITSFGFDIIVVGVG